MNFFQEWGEGEGRGARDVFSLLTQTYGKVLYGWGAGGVSMNPFPPYTNLLSCKCFPAINESVENLISRLHYILWSSYQY